MTTQRTRRTTTTLAAATILTNPRTNHVAYPARTRGFAPEELQLSRTRGQLADTRWEPAAVYANLRRLRVEAATAGIPVLKVSAGDIRADALNPAHRFASMPLFVKGPHGERGMARRQCTSEYKLRPLKAKARELVGHPHPARVPKGVYAEQAIGISTDEFHRAKDSGVHYLKNTFPLIELGWTRADCHTYLRERGWGNTPRSACLGCPYHANHVWRRLRDENPAEWADVVSFDHAIRAGHPRASAEGQPLRGEYFLHHSRVPLDQADLRARHDRTGGPDDGPDPGGCSPWGCRSGQPAPTTASTPNDEAGAAGGRAAA